MKTKKFRYPLIAALILITLPSCFQDLGQNPPFDYPEEPPKPPITKEGQIFYMSFDTDYKDSVSMKEASKVGNPSLVDGKVGKAYAGAQNSYLTFKLSDMFGQLVLISLWDFGTK